MWTWEPNHRQALFDATFLTIFFVGAYGEIRMGALGVGTAFFIGMVWRILDAPPGDYQTRVPS